MATTAQIEEREADSEIDGCYECGNDNFKEVKGEWFCATCGKPYSEDL